MKSMNLNDECWVDLTPTGEKIWAEHWNRYTDYQGKVPKAIYDSHVEKDGKVRFQLWELMSIFGSAMFKGNPDIPLKGNLIWLDV